MNETGDAESLYKTVILECCSKCCIYVSAHHHKETTTTTIASKGSACWLCLGLWTQGRTESEGTDALRKAIEDACLPYGGISKKSGNRFSRLPNQSHTVSLSGDLCLRYNWLASFSSSPRSYSSYLQDLKQHLYGRIRSILGSDHETMDPSWRKEHKQVFEEEEQGSLSIHLLCLPPKDFGKASLSHARKHSDSKKHKNHRKKYNKRQKCGPFTTQGGDPRQNLEVRLLSKGYDWISQSTAEDVDSSSLSTSFSEDLDGKATRAMEYHVAVFRRPMFLYGYYTKTRRDVSQTPFVVLREEPGKTLGVTSVEEQICGPIEERFGISKCNNLEGNNNANSGGVVYGMIKFHASGREDMDVRMLVRSDSNTCHGRPFCVQIIDALKPFQDPKELITLVEQINQTNVCTTPVTSGVHAYGNNPLGVGISPESLRPVSASVFSGLQGDTESKTKHYGCHCWSKEPLPPTTDLSSFLFRSLPFTIQQKTPVRVLHRRTNAVRERQILQAKAIRIDDHHFRLELSTQAGTYIKEFVSGDFGRTLPSVASLLGCKTTLLQLDCEGIEIPNDL